MLPCWNICRSDTGVCDNINKTTELWILCLNNLSVVDTDRRTWNQSKFHCSFYVMFESRGLGLCVGLAWLPASAACRGIASFHGSLRLLHATAPAQISRWRPTHASLSAKVNNMFLLKCWWLGLCSSGSFAEAFLWVLNCV